MLRKNSEGLYYCTKHNVLAQFCTNHITGELFLKCPSDTSGANFDCGTESITSNQSTQYEPFTPNLDNSYVSFVQDLIDKSDEDERN